MLNSFSIIDKKKKSKGRVDGVGIGTNNLQFNRSYREMDDADVRVLGDFDSCSNIV